MTGQEEKKKTCGKKQHVKIDIRKGMSKLICCKFTVGRNYNSTYDTQALLFGLSFDAMIAWIIAGLPWDLIHGVSNFFCGMLIVPIITVLHRMERNGSGC